MAEIHSVGDPTSVHAVLFLHGVNGNWQTTWVSDGDEQFSWPHQLAEATGWDVRILEYDVNTSWGRSTMPLQDRAVNIVATIESDPTLARKDLALVCHSFGGLVAKQMVRHAVDDGHQTVLDHLAAIVFVATPHDGDFKADFLVYLKHLLGSTVTLEDLRAHSPLLRDLAVWYRKHHDSIGLKSLVFFEKQRMKLRWFRTVQVVNDSSADPGIPDVRPIPVDADHETIAKPLRNTDVQFANTLQFLKQVFSVPADLGKLPSQYAGVPYRVGTHGIQLLLVRTSGGRWTFPKGSRNRTDQEEWQAAERETDEESGAIGTIEREPFTVYRHAKREHKAQTMQEFAVRAFLLAVKSERTDFPERTARTPRWFTPDQAKGALAEARAARYANEFARVVDLAVACISRASPDRPSMTAEEEVRVAAQESLEANAVSDVTERTARKDAAARVVARLMLDAAITPDWLVEEARRQAPMLRQDAIIGGLSMAVEISPTAQDLGRLASVASMAQWPNTHHKVCAALSKLFTRGLATKADVPTAETILLEYLRRGADHPLERRLRETAAVIARSTGVSLTLPGA